MFGLIKKISLFSLGVVLLLVIGMTLPPPPRITQSMVFAKVQKDSLLRNVTGPRIIVVGGSNTSYGLDSQIIKDSLSINPINTGITYELGLIYMLESTIDYVQEGDIVILSPEYQHFFGSFAYGREFLLYSAFDVDGMAPWELSLKHWENVYSFFPKYAFSRFKPTQYLTFKGSDINRADSYNRYGDLYVHWNMPQQAVPPFNQISHDAYNPEVMDRVLAYRDEVERRGAHFFATFPGTQRSSYENCEAQIQLVHQKLKAHNVDLLGTPERYIMPDSLMFNFPYHMVKEGVDRRTRLLVEDLQSELAGIYKGPHLPQVDSSFQRYHTRAVNR
jgi:hypothetical protein